MVKVEFLGPIDKKPLDIKAGSLRELKNILNKDESLKKWLENSAVAVNDKIVKDLDIKLQSGDRVVILPPVCGG